MVYFWGDLVTQTSDGFFGWCIRHSFVVTACLIGTYMRGATLSTRPWSSWDWLGVWKAVFIPFVFTLRILSFEQLPTDTANAV
jgi:hypothetical protein